MQTDEQKLNMYREALVHLCISNGGSISVIVPDETQQGTLLNRITPDGLEFKFVPDIIAQ